jgi:hypothetical protein
MWFNAVMSIFRRLFGGRDDDPQGAPERLPSPDELVPLTRAESETEASIFRSILEDNGIGVMVKNRDALSVQSGMMARPWSQELWVLRKDLRRAREVLEIDESPR